MGVILASLRAYETMQEYGADSYIIRVTLDRQGILATGSDLVLTLFVSNLL